MVLKARRKESRKFVVPPSVMLSIHAFSASLFSSVAGTRCGAAIFTSESKAITFTKSTQDRVRRTAFAAFLARAMRPAKFIEPDLRKKKPKNWGDRARSAKFIGAEELGRGDIVALWEKEDIYRYISATLLGGTVGDREGTSHERGSEGNNPIENSPDWSDLLENSFDWAPPSDYDDDINDNDVWN